MSAVTVFLTSAASPCVCIWELIDLEQLCFSSVSFSRRTFVQQILLFITPSFHVWCYLSGSLMTVSSERWLGVWLTPVKVIGSVCLIMRSDNGFTDVLQYCCEGNKCKRASKHYCIVCMLKIIYMNHIVTSMLDVLYLPVRLCDVWEVTWTWIIPDAPDVLLVLLHMNCKRASKHYCF